MLVRRLLITSALLVGAAAAIEWHCARELARYREGGGVVPPFGCDRSPAGLAKVREKIARLERQGEHLVRGRFDARYGWTNVPGSYVVGDDELHVNALGARGAREFGPTPPAGHARVLCLGDSFTYGTEVADGEDWPAVLDARTAGLEVINLGVGGWGLDQTYLRWQDVGADLAPDVVLFGFYLGSIGRNANRFRPYLYPADPNPLAKPRFRLVGEELELVPQPYATRAELLRALDAGTLEATLAEGDHWAGDAPFAGWSHLSTLLASRRADRRRQLPTQYARTDEDPFRVTLALLDALAGEARAAGAEPLVLLFPPKDLWQYELGDDWADHVYWRTLRGALDERAVPYLDLFGPLRDGSAEEMFAEVHLSPAGNAVVAEAVGAWTAARGG